MNITVKHEITLSPELAAFFSGLLAPTQPITAPVKKTVVPKEEKTVELLPIETTIATTANTETEITLEQLRAKVAEKSKAGKKEDCKKLLSAYGVSSVGALPAEHYADFLSKINAL